MALLREPGRDFGAPTPPGRALSLPDLERGGLGVVVATIFAPAGQWKGLRPPTAARRQIACYDELLYRFEERIFRVESRGDLALCKAGGPIGMVHLMEGADPIERAGDLTRYADQGVRFIGLAWNKGNRYAGGTQDTRGLSDEGRDLLGAMRQEGLVPDLSHLNPQALDDVLHAYDGLVVASHSNAHALCPHARNLADRHLEAIAERNGVVGIVLYGPFLNGGTQSSLRDVVRHIEHVAEVAGVEHVGIGSDLDGGFTVDKAPDGIGSVADLGHIGTALVANGWSPADVQAVMGGNWLRAIEQALPE